MATKTTDKGDGDGLEPQQADSPLLDLSDQSVKRMIKLAKKRGFVTHEELNEVLPSEEVTSDQIEDVYTMLNEMGINVVEQEEVEAEAAEPTVAAEADDEEEGGELVEAQRSAVPAKAERAEPTDRTDDPVRMYLREMGSVELLSREGEIAIAKRIEAGREAMIAGLKPPPSPHARSVEARRVRALEKELRRKDKALAEAAALLVLQKKVQALWGDEDEDTKRESDE